MPPKKTVTADNKTEAVKLHEQDQKALDAATAAGIKQPEDISPTEPPTNAELGSRLATLENAVNHLSTALGDVLKLVAGVGQTQTVAADNGNEIADRLAHIEDVLTKYYRDDFVVYQPHDDIADSDEAG